MLRPTEPSDSPAIIALATETGVFQPHEIVALSEVLDDYHASNREYGHACFTLELASVPVGFVYYAPSAMTDRTYEVWWIAVANASQGQGHGKRLLDWAEHDVRAQNGRLLLIETSSLPHYVPTCEFYRKHGYTVAGQIPDFYSDGDDKLIFWKKLHAPIA